VSGRLIYAVGDVHGRLDLLERAAEAIHEHLAGRDGKVIMLGDYVDRGPESRGVVEFLMRAQAEAGAAMVCLKGNHEDIMLGAMQMADPTCDMMWMGNGGGPTLASYGGAVPAEHLAWMDALPVMVSDGHRLYVHAGVMPGLGADEQDEQTCMWIREKFLRADAGDLPMHVVHGHTPQWAGKPDPAKPELLPHRTNLDTAAFYTGVLTVGVFDPALPGGPLEVLTISAAEVPA
jgi:serine/threonine protein phosphatase 1